MPKMMDDEMQDYALAGIGNFGFSAIRPEKVAKDASEFTLVTIIVDVTTSVTPYAVQLGEMVQAITKACQKSPRKENLLMRVVKFNEQITEVHGFKQIKEVNVDTDYLSQFIPSGMTALYDATDTTIEALGLYAKDLYDQEVDVNAAVYIITDGEENASIRCNSPASIKNRLAQIYKEEALESIITILVGLTPDSDVNTQLEDFKNEAGLSQYISVGEVTPSKIGKLGKLISQSISSQSDALGTGGPSKQISYSF